MRLRALLPAPPFARRRLAALATVPRGGRRRLLYRRRRRLLGLGLQGGGGLVASQALASGCRWVGDAEEVRAEALQRRLPLRRVRLERLELGPQLAHVKAAA